MIEYVGLRFRNRLVPAIHEYLNNMAEASDLTVSMDVAQDIKDWVFDNFEHLSNVGERVLESQIYDCKSLDPSFVGSTGEDRANEYWETRDKGDLKLPYDCCVFEFDQVIVYAENDDEDGSLVVRAFGADKEAGLADLHYGLDSTIRLGEADIDSGLWHLDIGRPAEGMEREAEDRLGMPATDAEEIIKRRLHLAMFLTLGIVTLFAEKLLTVKTAQGATDAVNQRRLRKGKAALESYRIVVLNLAETRRRTGSVALHRHESPMLHWRRGSWHTLYRGSEFEKRVWHKRCLVGDADKGFVQKHYKPVWSPTIH